MDSGLRYFGGAVAFGFAALWIMASLAAALVCLLSAIVGWGVVFAAECARGRRAQASSAANSGSRTLARSSRTPGVEDTALWADALNNDLGHIYEPTATTSPLARDVEYGWPAIDESATPSETLH